MLDLTTIDNSWTLFLDRDGVINFERNNIFMAILKSIIEDPLPLWYTVYLCITIISITVNDLFLSLLLLGIIRRV
jgi:hypothetical protein